MKYPLQSLKVLLILSLAVIGRCDRLSAQYCTTGFFTSTCTAFGDYCNSFSTTGGSTNISNLNTGCSNTTTGYTFFNTQTHTGTPGSNVGFTIVNTPNDCENYNIWVDWNQNGLFTDFGEDVYASTSCIPASGSVTGSFMIPPGATPGTTRLRVRCNYGSNGTPCGQSTWGEVEDYNFVVAGCSGTPPAPTITTAPLSAPLCSGSTKVIAASNAGAPAGVMYQWEQSASSSGPWTNAVGGSGATTLTYTTPALSVTTWYRLKVTCGTNTATSTAYQVQIGLPQPGAISGSSTYCAGSIVTYSITPVAGASSYTWTLPAGWSGSSTTNTITVTQGSTGGNISVSAMGTCGTSQAQTLAVTPGTPPAQPANIAGNNVVCANTTQAYSVPAVANALSYTWTLPGGWTGTSTTNTITVNVPGSAGTISVAAVNGCGTGTPRTLAVTMTTSVPPMPGAISGNNSVCPSSQQTYSIPAMQNVLFYTWTLPGGWTGTSTTNTIPTTVSANGGTVQVTANNGCGNSPVSNLAVNVLPEVTPSVNITVSNTTICNGSIATFTANALNGGAAPVYQWLRNGSSVGTNSNTYAPNYLNNGDIITVQVTSSAACPTPATVGSNSFTMTVTPNSYPGINVNSNSGQDICSSTGVTFYTSIVDGGPNPSYQWMRNGAPVGINSATYTASGFANNDSVWCVLTTSLACPVTPVTPSNKMGLSVTQTVVPAVTITANPGTTITTGQTVTFTASAVNGGAQPVFYWYKNGSAIGGVTGPVYTTNTLMHNDIIEADVVSNAECAIPGRVTSNALKINNPTTSISSVNGTVAGLSLSPNPNNGQFTLAGSALHTAVVKVEIQTVTGQLVFSKEYSIQEGREWSVNVQPGSELANGLYLMTLTAGDVKAVKKFEISR